MKILMVAFCVSVAGHSQPLKFEVASIKPNTSLNTNQSVNRAPGGRLDCSNVSLRLLVSFAFNVRDYQIADLPEWASREHYDIFAKLSPEDAAKEPPEQSDAAADRLRQRTQALLADRFGLVYHNQTREMPVYFLMVAKGGSKLTPTETKVGPQISRNDRRIMCKKVTMTQFADIALSSRMNRPVLDKTGLTGEYDLLVEFAPDEVAPHEGDRGDHPAADPVGPSFLTALQEQLGLRLDTGKGPGLFLVIDKIERPSGN